MVGGLEKIRICFVWQYLGKNCFKSQRSWNLCNRISISNNMRGSTAFWLDSFTFYDQKHQFPSFVLCCCVKQTVDFRLTTIWYLGTQNWFFVSIHHQRVILGQQSFLKTPERLRFCPVYNENLRVVGGFYWIRKIPSFDHNFWNICATKFCNLSKWSLWKVLSKMHQCFNIQLIKAEILRVIGRVIPI